jgi:hypothetical protein
MIRWMLEVEGVDGASALDLRFADDPEVSRADFVSG